MSTISVNTIIISQLFKYKKLQPIEVIIKIKEKIEEYKSNNYAVLDEGFINKENKPINNSDRFKIDEIKYLIDNTGINAPQNTTDYLFKYISS